MTDVNIAYYTFTNYLDFNRCIDGSRYYHFDKNDYEKKYVCRYTGCKYFSLRTYLSLKKCCSSLENQYFWTVQKPKARFFWFLSRSKILILKRIIAVFLSNFLLQTVHIMWYLEHCFRLYTMQGHLDYKWHLLTTSTRCFKWIIPVQNTIR